MDDESMYDFDINIKYKDYCDCNHLEIDGGDDDNNLCPCENNVAYNHDKFMHDKIPKYPKNTKLQQYYDAIFPKRFFKTKIFYYLPIGAKYIFTTNVGINIQRIIEYYYIHNKLVLISDRVFGLGDKLNHCHTPCSNKFQYYIEKLNNLDKANDKFYSERIID